MSETADEKWQGIDEKELNRYIQREIAELLEKSRVEIITRAHAKLRADYPMKKQAAQTDESNT